MKKLVDMQQYQQALDLFDKQSKISTDIDINMAIKACAKLHNYEDYRQMSVLFEHIQIHRATICSLTNKIIFIQI